jgi:hypothetical protein
MGNKARLSKGPQEVIQPLGGQGGIRNDLDSLSPFIEVLHALADSDWLFLGLGLDKVNGSFGHSVWLAVIG